MPWMETSPVEQRERFIRDHRLDLYGMTELCARYGISRKTGYKWLTRYDEGGLLACRIAAGRRSTVPTASRGTSPH
jgi:transposase